LINEGLETQLLFHRCFPVRRGEVMIYFQFPEKTLVRHAVFFQELLAHSAVKCSNEVTRKILINTWFVLQSARDLKSYALHKLCRACGIMEFPRDMPVGPRPKSFGHRHDTGVD
jgi:hypothetical protein